MYFKHSKKTDRTLETTNFILLGFLAGFIYLCYKKIYKHALFLFLLIFILLMAQRTILNLDYVKSLSSVQGILFYLFLHIITNIVQILYIIFVYKDTEYFYKAEMDYEEISEQEFLKLHYKEPNHVFGAVFKIMYYFFGFLIYCFVFYYLILFLLSNMGMVQSKLFFQFCFYFVIAFFLSVIFIYLKLFVSEILRFAKILANYKT